MMAGGFTVRGENPGFVKKTYFFNWDTKSWSTGVDMNLERNSHHVWTEQDILEI